jgi:hypothetical protein
MQMTRSPTLQLKKPASIICETEGDDRCGQCEKVLFRTRLRVLTSTKILDKELVTGVSVFSLFKGCSSLTNAENMLGGLFVVGVIFVGVGEIDKTNRHEGLRCLWIANGFMSDVKSDTSSPHVRQRAMSPSFVYSNPAECIE